MATRRTAYRLNEQLHVIIRYFVPNARKHGGEYRTVSDAVKKISTADRTVTMAIGEAIPIDEIMSVEI